MIGYFPAVLNFNQLFLKLNPFICNYLPVLPNHSHKHAVLHCASLLAMQWKCCKYRVKDPQLRQFWLTIGQQNLTSNNHQLPGDFLQCSVSFAISSHCLPWRVWATPSQIKATERPICIQHKPLATARFIWGCCLRIYIISTSSSKSPGCFKCIGRALFKFQSYKLGGRYKIETYLVTNCHQTL